MLPASLSLTVPERGNVWKVIQNYLLPLLDGQRVLVRLGTSFLPRGKENVLVLVSLVGSWWWEAGGEWPWAQGTPL